MSFIKTAEEIEEKRKKFQSGDFFGAKMLTVYYETKPEIVKKLLPPPLKPTKYPLAFAFIASYNKTNFGLPYNESAIFLRADFNGEQGNYCIAMHVTDDLALILGREIFGYPKKIANIVLKVDGDKIEGFSERLGTRYIELKANITGKFNDMSSIKRLSEIGALNISRKNPLVNFNYKCFNSPKIDTLDYNPRLIREEIVLVPTVFKMGEVDIKLDSSVHDPWSEIEVVNTYGAMYIECDFSMKKGDVVAEIDQKTYEPYFFAKLDWY